MIKFVANYSLILTFNAKIAIMLSYAPHEVYSPTRQL